MIQLKCFAVLSIALAAGLPAFAQTADVDPAGPQRGSTILWDNGAGSTKAAIMYSNGGLNEAPGGCSGFEFSAIEGGLTTYGAGHAVSAGISIADDFVVPAGEAWTLSDMKWLAYQTGAPSTGTITDIVVNVVPGADPNGVALPGGGSHYVAPNVFTGIYRTTAAATTNCDRAVMEITADMSWVPVLAPGQYWITVQCAGSLASGPWCPPTVPWLASDNGQQDTGLGFVPLTIGQGGAPADFPFALNGDNGAGGGATQYCFQNGTAGDPSVPGCYPILSATDLTLATGSWNVTSIPRSGTLSAGGNTVGLWIYNNTAVGQSTFTASQPYGTLCLPGFKRTNPACGAEGLILCSHPNWSAGTGDCATVGANLGVDVNCGLGIAVNQDVNAQGWLRDPTLSNSGKAIFTNAIYYTVQ